MNDLRQQPKPARNPKQRYPRSAAVRVITRVLADRVPLDDALSQVVAESGLDSQARAWVQEVSSGTLRWRGRLDQILDSTAIKRKPSGWLRKVLLTAIYQLVAQDRIAPGAIVSDTVTDIKRKEGEAPSRFANAVLRKIGDHAAEYRSLAFPETAPENVPEDSQQGALEREQALWASMPDWLWNRLAGQQGLEWAKAYAAASLDRPVIWIRSKDVNLQASWAAIVGPVPGSFQLTEGGAITERPGFKEGGFFVQDVSSQLLIHEVSSEVKKALGEGPHRALDLCAAPGGKTAGLSWNGFEVTATDRGEIGSPRFALLKQTVARVAPSAQVISRSEVGALPNQDLVWVDSPCSGSGILRRHPDVRWLRQEKELESLHSVQQLLLKEAWTKVKAGGFLVYSVCSVLKEEGPGALDAAGLRGEGGATVVKEWLLCPQNSPNGDGFYAALIKK
jgi:16S rRNA (cytosine967-C5)-methyltransferase